MTKDNIYLILKYIYLYTYQSVFIYPSIYLSIYSSIHLSIYSSIHLFFLSADKIYLILNVKCNRKSVSTAKSIFKIKIPNKKSKDPFDKRIAMAEQYFLFITLSIIKIFFKVNVL